MSDLDRLARAAHDACVKHYGQTWRSQKKEPMATHRVVAKAVLKEMREPSEAVLQHIDKLYPWPASEPPLPQDAWQAMIDFILKDQK